MKLAKCIPTRILKALICNRGMVFLLLLIFLGLPNTNFGQTEQVSECLELIRLTENTYIHTCKNNNGIVHFSDGEAIIVSTPDSDTETQHLIDWVGRRARIVAYVIDRWHPDAMEGIDIVHKNGISTYANDRTRRIAREKNLPVPLFGFKTKLELDVGNHKMVCHYLGEAHTSDGIVVWIPNESILFGGNGIRNDGGWLGNIADANLLEWSRTTRKIGRYYGKALYVIPGHGAAGGAELIDYTAKLYDFSKKKNVTMRTVQSSPLVNLLRISNSRLWMWKKGPKNQFIQQRRSPSGISLKAIPSFPIR